MTATLQSLACIEPLLLPLLARCRFIPSADVDAVAVDHDWRILFNPGFLAAQPPKRRLFYLAHELGHLALGHHRLLADGVDRDLANYAADVEVNLALLHVNLLCREHGFAEPFDLPEDAIVEPHLLHVPAREIVTGTLRRRQGRRLWPRFTGRTRRHCALRTSLFNPSVLWAVYGDTQAAVLAGRPSVLIES